MKIRILVVIILSTNFYNSNSQPSYAIPNDVKTILFLGNSITYAGQYISYIDAWFTIKYPGGNYKFINVGLPSETVSGLSEPNHANGRFPRPDLHERLARVLEQTKPDLVFACYGMNDGIYLPFENERFQKFRDGINWLHKEVEKTGASIIHITPPIYDERKGKAYANVLDIYSDWLISKRYTNNWQVIDLHWPMRKYLEDKRLVDNTFVFAKDGVHPNKTGHWVMAKEILLYLGEDCANAESISGAVSFHPKGKKILQLVEEKQKLMKDAWLTSIGHERPGMAVGLPLGEAKLKEQKIETQTKKLLAETTKD